MRGLFVIVLLGACVPTAARKSAHIEPGFDLEVNGGAQLLLEGVDENGQATETEVVPHAEIDVQWGFAVSSDMAIALQLKVPYNFLFTAVDAFLQLPSPDNELYYGIGAELGITPSVYAVVTQYLGDSLYLSLTPRLILLAGSEVADSIGLNPQLSVGHASDQNVSLFMSYMRVLGDGFDFAFDLFGSGTEDLRKDFLILGAAVRF